MRQEGLLLILINYLRCIRAYIFYIGIIQVLISCHYVLRISQVQKTASLEMYCVTSHSWNSGQNNTMHPMQTGIKMWQPH